MNESAPLLGETAVLTQDTWRNSIAEHLESNKWHLIVIFLTSLDAIFVLSDISYDFLKDPACYCSHIECPEDPKLLEYFSLGSILITGLFLIEVPLALWCFGQKYYTTVEHAWLHLFDAVVIFTTFILEVFLRGKEAEIASLLIILRLWRLMKLVSTVGVGVTEYNEVLDIRNVELREWKKEKESLLRELEEVKRELEEVTRELKRR